MAAAEAFWRERLKGFTSPTRLMLRKSKAKTSRHMRREVGVISADMTAALLALARRRQLTLNTLLQAAWSLLLSDYSGEQDIVFGTTVAGRPAELPGCDEMIGLFINTIPFRARVEPDRPLLEWLQELQARETEARQYDYAPLARIQSWSGLAQGAHIAETLLLFENYPGAEVKGERVSDSDMGVFERTNFPIAVYVEPGSEIRIQVDCIDTEIEDAAVSNLCARYAVMISALAGDENRLIKDAPRLSDSEKLRALTQWNKTPLEPSGIRCVHEVIQDQIAKRPDSVALQCGADHITYRELGRRAEAVAVY